MIPAATPHPTAKPTPKPTPTPTPIVTTVPTTEQVADVKQITYVLNKSSKKFHRPNCESVGEMLEKNKLEFTGTREEVIKKGYTPCKRCEP
ncbi:MAG: hypothetical protein IJH36_03135 [Clostridia bacterium]|nr:hypothetical protein [Clostridia bacterium]